MNKKRLFAGIAAVATAFTMCFALSACNNDGKEKPVGDNSVNSGETWIKAFEDSVASTNYKLAQKMTVTGKSYNEADESVDAVRTTSMEVSYDGVGLKAHAITESKIQIGKDNPKQNATEIFLEVSGSNFVEYNYNITENDSWYAYADEYVTENEAKEVLETRMKNSGLDSLTAIQFKGTGDNEKVTGTLAELYSLFDYNSQTQVYSATLISSDSYSQFEMTLQIAFKDGKLYKVINDYVQGEGDGAITCHAEVTITYGGVSVTIPQEAKDALEDEEE